MASLLRHKLGFSARRSLYSLSAVRFLSGTKRPAKAKRRDEGEANGTLIAKESERTVPTELHLEATEAYVAYAMSVLLGRALPDVRDGLKPVHRRILFAMHGLGLSSKKPHRKCARVVGEVLGKFHPHGDTAVYHSLVRMAQDFSLRWPLIRGHGNFGSIDADPPAAMRYTECRLEALTEAMLLADLDQDAVEFVPNFDSSQLEPALLPARVPNLLLNGSSGIAVGMATNIPPHNLGELVDALSVLIHNPEATLQELLEAIPGPDFPTGGLIMGNAGIREAYHTGRGSIVVRGRTEIEELLDSKTNRSAIIIKEVPYQTNKAALVEKIANLVENKMLEGISDIRDESDRGGMRVVVELKKGADPAIVLNNLFRQTSLQSSFSCNMVGILDGQPKLMGLKELLQAFLDFRCLVIERRARFKLSQAQDRKHIVEGILLGLENADGVIRIVRESPSNAMASEALRNEYGLSEKQAEALLDMTLRKLTLLESNKFIDEGEVLTEQVSYLTDLLSSKQKMLNLIEEEAIEVKNKFSNPRRSMLEEDDSGELDDLDVIPNEEMLLTLSEKGYLKRMKPSAFSLQHRGTIGKSVGKMRVNDAMSDFLVCLTHDHVLFFSDKGLVYSCRAYKIPECAKTAAGTPVVQILSLSDGERVTSIIPVSEFSEDQFLVMLTVQGYIKKVPLNLFSSIRQTGIIAIQLVLDDELKWVKRCSNEDLVTMASQNGWALVSSCEVVRSVGRITRGSVAMRLKDGDKVACMDIIPAAMRSDLEKRSKSLGAPWLLFVSEGGFGKRVPLTNFNLSRLNRLGLIGYKLQPEDRLVGVFFSGYSLGEDGESDEQLVLVSQMGTVNRIKVRDISIQTRYAMGVILMRLEYDGKIQSASLISPAGEELDAEKVE